MVVSERRSPEHVRWIVVKRHLSASTQNTERPFFTVAVGVKAGYFGPGYSLLRRPNVVHLIDHSVDTGRKNIYQSFTAHGELPSLEAQRPRYVSRCPKSAQHKAGAGAGKAYQLRNTSAPRSGSARL